MDDVTFFIPWGQRARIKHDVVLEEGHQVAVPDGRQTTTAYGGVHQNAASEQSLLSAIDLPYSGVCPMSSSVQMKGGQMR